jgi:hypothetical protein
VVGGAPNPLSAANDAATYAPRIAAIRDAATTIRV